MLAFNPQQDGQAHCHPAQQLSDSCLIHAEIDSSQTVTAEDFAACLQHMAPSMTRGIDVDLDPGR